MLNCSACNIGCALTVLLRDFLPALLRNGDVSMAEYRCMAVQLMGPASLAGLLLLIGGPRLVLAPFGLAWSLVKLYCTMVYSAPRRRRRNVDKSNPT